MKFDPKEDSDKVVLIPEDRASQVGESQFEPGKEETLVYLKLVSLTQQAIRNASHDVASTFNNPDCKGYLLFSDCKIMRAYLHHIVDIFMDQAEKDSQLNK